MAAKLHLVKAVERNSKAVDTDGEDMYRYPANEERWEVSCEPYRAESRKPKLTDDRRRAS